MEDQNVALEAEQKTEQSADIRELDLEELCAVYGGNRDFRTAA